jgi:TolA-binding protein
LGKAEQKFGIGLNAGGQYLFGDRKNVNPGIGGEIHGNYQFFPFAELVLGFGYSALKYKDAPRTITDVYEMNLKTNFDIISGGMFRPYVTVGAGAINFVVGKQKDFAATGFGGGGLKVRLNPTLDLYLGADYKFTTTDLLDQNNKEGNSNDGYATVRSGVTYHFGAGRDDEPQVIASEQLPFYELDSDYQQAEDAPLQSQPADATGGTKNMEQYVRLKSRVDQLSGDLDSKEKEMMQLQNALLERRRMLESMRDRASGQPSKRIARNTSPSGFTEIYQEGLASYYNKNYTEAVTYFRRLIQQYPNHALAASSQFWLGQTLFEMKDYNQAVDELYRVLNYDRSLKQDDSLFLLGRAYLEMSDSNRAKESFARLLREYPASEFSSQAQNYLARL